MTDEFVLVTFWIRDGEREHTYDTILTKEQAEWSDEKLIQHCIDEDAHIDDEESGTYWVYYMEALAAVEFKQPMSRETKELFNSYRIW
jgi:hypothetical protein